MAAQSFRHAGRGINTDGLKRGRLVVAAETWLIFQVRSQVDRAFCFAQRLAPLTIPQHVRGAALPLTKALEAMRETHN